MDVKTQSLLGPRIDIKNFLGFKEIELRIDWGRVGNMMAWIQYKGSLTLLTIKSNALIVILADPELIPTLIINEQLKVGVTVDGDVFNIVTVHK